MTVNQLDDPLGSYEEWDEYQLDHTLIWVRHNSSYFPEFPSVKAEARDKANALLPRLLAEQSRAIQIVEAEVRKLEPEKWKIDEDAGVTSKLFSVWGIRILPFLEFARYEIGANNNFWNLTENNYPPYDEALETTFEVQRTPDGQMLFQAEKRGFFL